MQQINFQAQSISGQNGQILYDNSW